MKKRIYLLLSLLFCGELVIAQTTPYQGPTPNIIGGDQIDIANAPYQVSIEDEQGN